MCTTNILKQIMLFNDMLLQSPAKWHFPSEFLILYTLLRSEIKLMIFFSMLKFNHFLNYNFSLFTYNFFLKYIWFHLWISLYLVVQLCHINVSATKEAFLDTLPKNILPKIFGNCGWGKKIKAISGQKII